MQNETKESGRGGDNLNLLVGKKYLLKTVDLMGSPQPKEDWILVTWDGKHLADGDGVYWDEWFHFPEDIVPANGTGELR